jgi:hypothetical protein
MVYFRSETHICKTKLDIFFWFKNYTIGIAMDFSFHFQYFLAFNFYYEFSKNRKGKVQKRRPKMIKTEYVLLSQIAYKSRRYYNDS